MKNSKSIVLKKILLLYVFMLIAISVFSGVPQFCEAFKNRIKITTLNRTFYEKNVNTKFFINHPKNMPIVGISMDLADMQQIYENSDVEYYFTQEDVTYIMDIGIIDTINPQTWIMPDLDFVEYEIGENQDVTSSPYFSSFPNATHLQYYDYSEWGEYYYEYYQFSLDKIEVIGSVNVFESVPETDTLSFIVAPLPLNINTDFSEIEEFTINDTTYYTEQNIYVEGFGTLETPDGVFNCLKLANDFYFEMYFNGELVGSIETYVYTFYCENGYRLNLYLDTLENVFTGEVDVIFADVEIPSAITKNKEISQKENFCYPNPANEILNFVEVGNYCIYSFTGQKVLTVENNNIIDVSDLVAGLYLVKSENGHFQKIIIE